MNLACLDCARTFRLLCLMLLSVTLSACSFDVMVSVPVNMVLPGSPPRAPMSHWTAAQGRDVESLQAPDAVLRGWTFYLGKRDARRPHVLFFNGNAMEIDAAQSVYRELAIRGADVTAFDYRGYGFSSGKADVMQFRKDALAIYDKETAAGPVIVYGFSLGTAMASYVASQRNVTGLILAGTIARADEEFPVFARATGLSNSSIARMAPSADAETAFDEVGMVAHSNAPLLMIHSENDSLVPIQQGCEVFAACPSKQKKFVSVPGAGHNETVDSERGLGEFREFLLSIK